MLLLDLIAEQRIADAIAQGQFDGLPGAGKPLDLDDDPLVPEDLRVACRILRNAGFLPPEVEAQREASSLNALLRAAVDDTTRRKAAARLALLGAALEAEGRTLTIGDYAERTAARLGR